MTEPSMPHATLSPAARRVHAAALSLFARQGYEATSLAQIAGAVGMRKPSLYNHIDSKQALFLQLVEQVEAAFFALQDASLEASRGADVETRARALVEALSGFIFSRDQGAFYKRFLLFPPEALTDEVRRINARGERRIDQTLRGLFLQGQAEGAWRELSERAFLDAFYCLMDGLYTERFIYSRDEYERRLYSVWPIFWAGLRH